MLGLSDRWRSEGIGPTRLAVASAVEAPVLFVRRGMRPSGLGPPQTMTQFTWSPGAQPAGASS